MSAVDQSLAVALGLHPLGRLRTWDIKGKACSNIYAVRLRAVQEDSAPIDVHVVGCDDLRSELKVVAIIGMDLIAELKISSANGLEHLALQQPQYIDVSKNQPEPVSA